VALIGVANEEKGVYPVEEIWREFIPGFKTYDFAPKNAGKFGHSSPTCGESF
jgi:hypothetical protein